jgi:thiamine-phosphate pyrophosphorylase
VNGRRGRPGVLFVTDRRRTSGRPIEEVAAAALDGGAAMVQVREKDLDGFPLLRLTETILRAAAGRAPVLVNDRLDVALAAKAAGVHLPASGLEVGAVRRRTGRRVLIGRSVHSVPEARAAEKEGADFVLFGPVFETASKAAYGPPQGVEGLRRVAEAVRIPVWAIGGVNSETARALRGLPIAGVGAIGAIAEAADAATAVRGLLDAIGPGSSPVHSDPDR